MKKNKLKFFVVLLMFAFIAPSFNSTSNLFPIEDIKEETEEEIPKTSDTAPETVDIKSIRFVHEKGETNFLWEMVGIFYGAFNLGTYEGTYTSVAGNIHGLDVYSGSTGAFSNGRTIVPTMSEPAISIIQDHLDSGEFVHRFRNGYYIRPIGYSCSYPNTYYQNWVDDVEIPWTSVQTDGILRNGIIVEYMGHKVYYAKIYWNLHPTIILDSNYYNLQNVRIEVRDETTLEWLQQDPTDIVLQHSDYKLRIYDKNTNDLIFEDTSLVGFTYYRTISIPSIKITNNADEQITSYLFNRSTVPTDFYQYAYLDSNYESYDNSSYIENFDSNSFNDASISFENNSNDCPLLSLSYEHQIDIGENNTFQIYPIETVNEITSVKFWNNITLQNETLVESDGHYSKVINSSYSMYYSVEIYIEDSAGYYNIMKIDDIFVLKNRIRINLENLQNKYIQYSSIDVSASLYEFDGTSFSGNMNFSLSFPNGTIILEDQQNNLEYDIGYVCDYYTLICEYFGDIDNLATTVTTLFEVIPPPGKTLTLVYFDETPVFNLTINPYETRLYNMTSFDDEILYIMYFDIHANEIGNQVFNFSTTNTLDYTPSIFEQCRISLSDQLSNPLIFENYHIYIDSQAIYSNTFYRTVDSVLNISITDMFGNLLYEDEYNVDRDDNFIDLTLNQFSLKILNNMADASILNITNIENPLDFVLSENIAVSEIITISLKEGTYSIFYIDDADEEHTFEIILNSAKLIILNTTFRSVYFSLFSEDGLGVSSDVVRLYIDGCRKDVGFVWTTGTTTNVQVLDYFNQEIYNGDIDTSDITEFNIYVPLYTLLIANNYSSSMELVISREDTDIEFKQVIPADAAISYRFLGEKTYFIKFYLLNGTLFDSTYIFLKENDQLVPFGYKSIPIDSVVTYQTTLTDILFVIGIVSSLLITVIFVIRKSRKFEDREIDSNKKWKDKITDPTKDAQLNLSEML